jgi:uncharacterized SAM-binding protein YcdF (DUF218 family)
MGAACTVLVLWLVSPVPIFLNRPLLWNELPAPAAAIVCLGSGVDDGLPSSTGWHRIRTSVRLFQDGFAPVVVFSGGPLAQGGGRSVAEIYAESARLIGLPASAIVIEPRARNTADHPRRLLETDLLRAQQGANTPLLVVTTSYHGLRAALCFRRAGFTTTKIVTRYDGGAGPAPDPRPFPREVVYKLYVLLATMEEWAALGTYKVHGWI